MVSGYLVLNVGSTSIKSQWFDSQLQSQAVIHAEYGEQGLNLHWQTPTQAIQEYSAAAHDANGALQRVFACWQTILAAHDWSVSAIGHRVVHGGAYFDRITLITAEVLQCLEKLDAYAPLHNPRNRLGIALAAQAFPATIQFAVFDTAFHRHIPEYAGRYAIPKYLSANLDFYRYGFHGISCQYSLQTAASLLGKSETQVNLIIAHLGGGASITAVRQGISVDTSMGFSPTEGLIMATRCGDIDSSIALTLQREGKTWQQLDVLFNQHSGLKAVAGSSDMRQIIEQSCQQVPEAQLALEMFCYRVKKYLGAFYAVLGQVDALVFTGGIGEHAALVRAKIVSGLEPLGLVLDSAANEALAKHNRDLSHPESLCRIFVLPAQEEYAIAQQMANSVYTQ